MLTLFLVLSWAVGLALGYTICNSRVKYYLKIATEVGYRAGYRAGVEGLAKELTKIMDQKETTND